MKQGWKMVKLSEVLKHRKGFIQIDDFQKYKLCRVQTSARGIVLRSEVYGSEIRTKKQQVCKAGDFLVAEIDAKMGGYGIVPEDLEGAIVSSHYFLYDIIEDKLDRTFLEFFTQTPRFFEQVKAEGSTNYAAIRPGDVLAYEIPLPPLSEQQHIAGRLAALKGKIDAVRAFRGEQEKKDSAFRNGLFKQVCDNSPMVVLNDVLIPRREIVAVDPQKEYNQVTVKMQHKGVVLRSIIVGSEVGSIQLKAKEGDFIISKIDARNGAMGIIPKSLDNAIVTNDFPLFSFEKECLPKFFEFLANTKYFDQKCIHSSEGTTNRVRLKMDKFNNITVPLPPLSEQTRVIEILEKIEALKSLQIAQLSALEGLFPTVLERAFRGEW
jgi:type I restriction enzyme, S subunit